MSNVTEQRRIDNAKVAEAVLRNLHIDCVLESDSARQFNSRMLQMTREGLIIDSPTHHGQMIDLAVDEKILCTCKLGTEILRFSATVKGGTTYQMNAHLAIPALQLSEPAMLSLVQRRRYFRVSLVGRSPVDVTLWLVDRDQAGKVNIRGEAHGRIVDISAGGLSVLTRDRAFVESAKECQLWARFSLPGENESLIFHVMLMHVRVIESTGMCRLGLELAEFIEPGAHSAVIEKLVHFVTTQ